MIDLFDTHCHIHEAEASYIEKSQTKTVWQRLNVANPGQMIKEAQAVGVNRLLCIGTSLADSRQAIKFADKHHKVWATIGLHPHEANDYAGQKELLLEFASLANQPKVVGIGECGLDYFYEHSSKAHQAAVLEFQLQLAQDNNLPMVFHVRDAFDDFWPIFDNFSGIKGTIHSFTATPAELDQSLRRNLYISLNGIITFTKEPSLLTVATVVPLNHLLLETDAPFLTPKPYRGTVCKPEHVSVTAKFLSDLRGEPLDKIADATTSNAQALFRVE